jgi:ADP-ribose pyrophosphatase YjhB (NUDIX family)
VGVAADDAAPRRLQRVAAYAVVTDPEARLLLVRLSESHTAGRWILPGGGLDFGEHPADAMVREVREETGLRVTSWRLLDVMSVRHVPGDGGPDDEHAVQVLYGAEVADPFALVHETDGTTDLAAWFSPAAVRELDVVGLVAHALARVSP